MFTKKFAMTLVAACACAATAAWAAQGNPLDPSYFADKASVPAQAAGAGAGYADARNPLYPGYVHSGQASQWSATDASVGQAYVDQSNPLHPMHRWF
jgi:hypothetical protein